MALTKEEEDELKVLFSFPLIMNKSSRWIGVRNKNYAFLAFVGKASNNDKFQEIVFEIISDKKIKTNLKNINFGFKDNNYFTMNGEAVFAIQTVSNIENFFKFDFIKAQRINRIYREYILDRMTKAFNKNH
jgi:hypothetical protein